MLLSRMLLVMVTTGMMIPTNMVFAQDNHKQWLPILLGNYLEDSATVPANEGSNYLPTAQDDAAHRLDSDSQIILDVVANDSDRDDDTLSLLSVTAPANGGVELYSDTQVSYTPNLGYCDSDSFTYTITDGQGGEATANVSITCEYANRVPTVVNDSAALSYGSVTIDVLVNDSDPDNDPLVLLSVTSPQFGEAIVNSDAQIEYSILEGYCGEDDFTYTVSDGNGLEANGTVYISCTPRVPSPPRILQNIIEVNSPVQMQEVFTVVTDTYAYDGYYDLNELWVVLDDTASESNMGNQQNITTTFGKASVINHDGWFNQANHFKGQVIYLSSESDGTDKVDVVRYKLRNADGLFSETWGELRISLDGSHDQNYDIYPVSDEFRLEAEQSIDLNVLANDADIQSYYSLEIYQNPQHGSVIINDDKTIKYTPDEGFIGEDSFQYRILGNNLYVVNSAPANVTLYVATSNIPPVAVEDELVTLGDNAAVVLDVIANDTDSDGDAIWLLSVGTASFGEVVRNSNRSVQYTPNVDYCGPDSFSYIATDLNIGGEVAGTVNVECIPPPPDIVPAPKAIKDNLTTHGNDQYVILDVIANDLSVDGGFLYLNSVGQAEHGVVTWNTNRTVKYTSQSGYCGTDTFTYELKESGVSATATGTVALTIECETAPTAQNDWLLLKGELLTVSIDVLSNDLSIAGGGLSISSFTQANYGSVTKVSDGHFQYIPNAGYCGTDSFSYELSESGLLNQSMATVTVECIRLSWSEQTVYVGQSVELSWRLANTLQCELSSDFDIASSEQAQGTTSKIFYTIGEQPASVSCQTESGSFEHEASVNVERLSSPLNLSSQP